jgi:hypothetical protein
MKYGAGSLMFWESISWYSILLVPLLPIMAELLQRSTWRGWVIRCIPWSRRYFRTTMQFSKRTKSSIHTAATVQSLFEDHEGELQHFPWSARSPDLNITEPLWSVSETRVRNRFPAPHH